MYIPLHMDFEFELDEYDLRSPGVIISTEGAAKMMRLIGGIRRQQLAQLTGKPVHFNWMWRIDPSFEQLSGDMEVVLNHHWELLSECAAAGDEIGVHFHPQRWNVQSGEWEMPFNDPDWIEEVFIQGFEKFVRLSGIQPKSLRLSDNFLFNERMLNLMEKLGIKQELSLEPDVRATHQHWENTPPDLDYSNFPAYPYQPEIGNYRRPGKQNSRDLWLIPTSTGYINKVIYDEGIAFKREYVALDLAFHPPTFAYVLNSLLETQEYPYLMMVGNSYLANGGVLNEYFETNFNFLLSHPLASLFYIVNSTEAVKCFSTEQNQLQTDPLYQAWLKQRLRHHRNEFEELERTYQTLEHYTRKLENEINRKNQYINQISGLRKVRSLKSRLGIRN